MMAYVNRWYIDYLESISSTIFSCFEVQMCVENETWARHGAPTDRYEGAPVPRTSASCAPTLCMSDLSPLDQPTHSETAQSSMVGTELSRTARRRRKPKTTTSLAVVYLRVGEQSNTGNVTSVRALRDRRSLLPYSGARVGNVPAVVAVVLVTSSLLVTVSNGDGCFYSTDSIKQQ